MKPKTARKQMKGEPPVSAMGFWLDNADDPGRFTIVDCGYVNHKKARDNADRLLAAMKLRRGRPGIVAIVGANRLLVRIPVGKLRVLARFPNIRKRQNDGYCWTTHIYEAGGEQFKLKYASS